MITIAIVGAMCFAFCSIVSSSTSCRSIWDSRRPFGHSITVLGSVASLSGSASHSAPSRWRVTQRSEWQSADAPSVSDRTLRNPSGLQLCIIATAFDSGVPSMLWRHITRCNRRVSGRRRGGLPTHRTTGELPVVSGIASLCEPRKLATRFWHRQDLHVQMPRSCIQSLCGMSAARMRAKNGSDRRILLSEPTLTEPCSSGVVEPSC